MEDSRAPSRLVVARRRAVALAVLVAVLALAWLLLLRGGGDSGDAPAPPAGVSAEVSARVKQMSPAQLADQVLLLGFDGTDPSAEIVDDLSRHEYGGVFVDADNWVDADQGAKLVAALRAAGREQERIPPLIAASQEGGQYRSFADLPPERNELEVGDEGSPKAAEDWAHDAAASLRSAGFDLDLFPIADIATLDSPLADRAFSDDPALVTELTAASIRGCNRAGLACAALHFPGLGAASEDTDRGPATIGLDAAAIEARDLAPFEAAFDEGMPGVVLSLGFYVAYDAVTPGALAEPVATGLLRDQLGYEGVAITDDLGAGAVRAGTAPPKAAVAALAAGADLIRIDDPANQRGVEHAIVAAVADGELPRSQLEQAASRVLQLKRSRGLVG